MAEARNNAYSTAFIQKVKGTQKVHSVHTERYTNLGSYKGWTLIEKKFIKMFHWYLFQIANQWFWKVCIAPFQ